MGYSPLEAGVAFLPFTVGIVIGAGLASNLVSRDRPALSSPASAPCSAAGALFGFSHAAATTPDFPADRDGDGSYVTDILPFILVMSFGMGLAFVPLTLTAVHHLRNEDSGIGSGVLNAMQQVGGALGLAVLATVATQTFTDRGAEMAQAAAEPQRPPAAPRRRRSSAALPGDRPAAGLHRGLDPGVPGRLDPDARAPRS